MKRIFLMLLLTMAPVWAQEKPDDQVQVGTHFVAPFIAAVRNGFRITYGFGFLYDRNYAPTNNNSGG